MLTRRDLSFLEDLFSFIGKNDILKIVSYLFTHRNSLISDFFAVWKVFKRCAPSSLLFCWLYQKTGPVFWINRWASIFSELNYSWTIYIKINFWNSRNRRSHFLNGFLLSFYWRVLLVFVLKNTAFPVDFQFFRYVRLNAIQIVNFGFHFLSFVTFKYALYN